LCYPSASRLTVSEMMLVSAIRRGQYHLSIPVEA
jgi:hypothetical protein